MLHATEALLGDDHNVVIRREQLRRVASSADREKVRQAASRYQRDLREKALKAGARVYAAKTKATVSAAGRAWRASQ
jgi:hypothetical protein